MRYVQAGAVRLAYRAWGPSAAPPVVLLHALGEQSADWSPVARELAASWRVYAPDLRGHGGSDWPGEYTVAALAAATADGDPARGSAWFRLGCDGAQRRAPAATSGLA